MFDVIEKTPRRLLEVGKDDGLLPAGLGCRDSLRLEMGYALYGNDLDEDTTPLEAGLGWVVKLDKGDFVGRDALVRQKEKGIARKLVGFRLAENYSGEVPKECHLIIENGDTSYYYAHASELLVSEGQYVEAGTVVALVGSTGNSIQIRAVVRLQ